MVVHDLDLVWTPIQRGKADAVAIVDADAGLTFSIRRQGFESVAWRHPKVLEAFGGIELIQLARRHRPEIRRARAPSGFRVPPIVDVLGPGVRERAIIGVA